MTLTNHSEISAKRPKALDLFCGAGGASVGLYKTGFDVIGVDIRQQKNYPFSFIQADALTFPLNGFDLIWASPPCQAYSAMRHAPGANGDAPKLISMMRDRLAQSEQLWVIENVEAARPEMIAPIRLCGTSFGLGAQRCELQRHRLFEANFEIHAPTCAHTDRPVIGVYGGHARKRSAKHGGRGTRDIWEGGHKAAAAASMGIDWMTLAEMSEAVPPAYSELIGKHALRKIALAANDNSST